LLPDDPKMNRLFMIINLERGLLISAGVVLIGVTLIVAAVNEWRLQNFGVQDYARSLRFVIPGSTLVALGFQAMLASFFMSILGLRRR